MTAVKAAAGTKVKPKAKTAVKPKVAEKKAASAKPKAAAKSKVAAKPKTLSKPIPAPPAATRETPVEALPPAAPARPKPPRAKPSKTAAPSGRPSALATVLDQLDDAKAEAIVTIDLDGKSAVADAMVVASGRSNRHVGAIADQVVEKLKAAGYRDLRVEGMPQCDWVLVDAGDVVVHIFRPEVRSFYNLEKLWSEHAPNERFMS